MIIFIYFIPFEKKLQGNNWKARRRLIAPAFHTKSLVNYLNVFNEKSISHASQLESIMIGANNLLEIDVYSVVLDLALDIACGILLLLNGL